jgi:predicted component of type VI protein secretion system
MTAQFNLVMRSGPTTGKIFPLEGEEIIVGRDASSGVAINDAEVSRKHARLILQGSAYVIQDLGSTNGTFVNSQRIATTQVLNPGDTVSFGENIVLQYDVVFDPNATMVASPKTPVTPMPVLKPVPAPAPVPDPAPVYSGQVPVPPPPLPASPVKKRGSRVWIILIIVVVLILCLCVVSPIIADALKLDCVIPFRWLFNIIGPIFGYGGCS